MTRRAIVLSGGGARGAYAAGVLRYIMDELTEDLGHPPRLDIICGTSVGAILGAWVAATMERPDYSGQRLWYLWRSMRMAETVRVSRANVWTMINRLFKDTGDASMEPRPGRTLALMNTRFFSNLVEKEIPFPQIRKNMENGLLDAVTVTCTDVHTGRATVFADYERSELPPWTRDPRRRAVKGPLTPEKVLASASIPVLFPSIKIDGRWYFDGGLRQNTPISPALRLGADHVLVVGLKSVAPLIEPAVTDLDAPSVSFALGKMLNALLLDPLDYDLALLERINGLLRHGERAFGKDEFIPTLNEVIEVYRGQGYRIVDTLLVRPTTDLGRLATDLAGQMRDSDWGSTTMRTIGRRVAEMQGYRESDFLSYLLFDGRYTGELLDLGWRDAQAKHRQLVRFFTDKR